MKERTNNAEYIIEDITAEQEQSLIAELKNKYRNITLEEGHYSGAENPSYIAVYALIELAFEVATKQGTDITSFFSECCAEVDCYFSENRGSEEFTKGLEE